MLTIKYYSTIYILFFSIIVCAQSNEEKLKEINNVAVRMFANMNNRDYNAIIDMTHPKVFEIAPKESIKELFKSMFEGNEDMTINVPKTNPDYKLSKLYINEKDSVDYAFISYDMKMDMTFHTQEFKDEEKSMMKTMMKSKGINVTFISNNKLDLFMQDRVTIILKDNFTNGKWVMVNYDPDSPLFFQILPESLLDNAKAYHQDLLLKQKKDKEE